MTAVDAANALKVMNQFLAKSDGRDKLTAAIQYAAMFISAGEPGTAKLVQGNVAAARKVFRVMRPLESLVPLLTNPQLDSHKPVLLELINKLKSILMAVYFGADHFVWAHQAGLLKDKGLTERFQKLSLYGWLGGSLCTVAVEAYEISVGYSVKEVGASHDEILIKRTKAINEINKRMITLVHAIVQLRPLKPRTVGFLGVVASVMNCYMLMPSFPVSQKPHKPALKPAPVSGQSSAQGTCPNPSLPTAVADRAELKTA